jgi:predicted solute-binding protein
MPVIVRNVSVDLEVLADEYDNVLVIGDEAK